MKVAVYGGSFDPVHIGHVMVVSHLLLNDPTIDRVLIVPCFKHAEKKTLTRFEHRLAMCGEAFDWLPRTEISLIEQRIGDTSFTLGTMLRLKEENPDWNLNFVMGSDLLDTCHTWDRWDELLKVAPPMPIGRAGITPVRAGDPTPISPIVSSTIIRQALAAADYKTAERYLPRGVLQYIKDEKLYLAVCPCGGFIQEGAYVHADDCER